MFVLIFHHFNRNKVFFKQNESLEDFANLIIAKVNLRIINISYYTLTKNNENRVPMTIIFYIISLKFQNCD